MIKLCISIYLILNAFCFAGDEMNVDESLVQGEVLKFDLFKKDGWLFLNFIKARDCKDEQYKS